MPRINATLQYEDRKYWDWGDSFERARELAELLGVNFDMEIKTPLGENCYASITVSADEMRDLNNFIAGLFRILGAADSPVFYVMNKPKAKPSKELLGNYDSRCLKCNRVKEDPIALFCDKCWSQIFDMIVGDIKIQSHILESPLFPNIPGEGRLAKIE
jgi:hypothetical protein